MLRLLFVFGICSLFCIVPCESFLVPSHSDSLRLIPSPTTLYAPPFTALHAKKKKKKKPSGNTICVNRQARRNYEIVDTLEAGISLLGTEVKSIRDGKMNLQDAFVKPSKNGRSCTLMNCHIGKHTMSGAYFQHEERRPKPLLVHKSEARKLLQKTEQTGMTIVPLKAYFNNDNKVKIQIALAKGKNVRDKRQDIKDRDMKRETSRIIKNFRL
mmetsp:Transcript_23609/g.55546  ORF Transcript_23609/g.55546 Transcript_23609/m.55546 type:complete len:213 (-) Transcript_23609:141-779(-)